MLVVDPSLANRKNEHGRENVLLGFSVFSNVRIFTLVAVMTPPNRVHMRAYEAMHEREDALSTLFFCVCKFKFGAMLSRSRLSFTFMKRCT